MTKFRLMLNLILALSPAVTLADDQVAPPAASTPPASDVRAACAGDAKTLCPDIKPGGGRVRQCLTEHKEQISEGCKQAVMTARQAKKSAT